MTGAAAAAAASPPAGLLSNQESPSGSAAGSAEDKDFPVSNRRRPAPPRMGCIPPSLLHLPRTRNDSAVGSLLSVAIHHLGISIFFQHTYTHTNIHYTHFTASSSIIAPATTIVFTSTRNSKKPLCLEFSLLSLVRVCCP